MYQRIFRSNNVGLTLLELLIAILLSGFIIYIAMWFYVSIQKNIAMHDALMNMQNNMRMVTQLLRTDIMHAGFAEGHEKIHSYVGPEIKQGTDAFTIFGANVNTVDVIKMENVDTFVLTDVSHFAVGDTLAVFDANSYEIFKVKEVLLKNNIIISEKPLQKIYPPHAEVSVYDSNTYYIAKTDRKNADGSLLYALYVKDIHSHKTELLEGFSNMKISYSVLENDDIQNVSSEQVVDWTNVRGISIAFELCSLNRFSLKKEVFLYVALRNL